MAGNALTKQKGKLPYTRMLAAYQEIDSPQKLMILPEEAWTLYEFCAKVLDSNSYVVQIGAGYGISSLAILESRVDIKLASIDISMGGKTDSGITGLDIERDTLARWSLPVVGQEFIQICGDSSVVGLNWTEQVDMVLVDGDHSYEGCKADIKAWLPNIKRGGYIFVHDYGCDVVNLTITKGMRDTNLIYKEALRVVFEGVDMAVNELLIGNPDLELVVHDMSLIGFKLK